MLDTFTKSYIETALWANGLEGYDLASEALAAAIKDCKSFQEDAEGYIEQDLERAGHDFFLTRNKHGGGFWDGEWGAGEHLTQLAHSYGEQNLYLGDDGLVYL